ncbi:hypothetical protein COY27_07225 [Candidatus Woesearchaeota archaeon CG_4_10_14_0_2_um_filter_33_13]|nr:MAG: hypothetical protein COY27_07225 [Candidatus Woesearchaeota archaeon CG_4_10_14_0_2_um_filter_33_13]
MLAKIWKNEVNRIDNVIGSFNFLVFVFVVYAKVSMHKIYGSVSVPEKVIKILDLTYGTPVIRGERSESATSPSTADRSRGAEESLILLSSRAWRSFS